MTDDQLDRHVREMDLTLVVIRDELLRRQALKLGRGADAVEAKRQCKKIITIFSTSLKLVKALLADERKESAPNPSPQPSPEKENPA